MPTLTLRRTTRLAAALAGVTLLAGCTTPGTGTVAPAADDTRSITSEAGPADIPVDPQQIVALDEPAALNLLSIGITPDAVYDSWRTAIPREILAEEGIEILSTSGFYPELEEVAALEPDLIVGTWAEGFSQNAPDYAAVAPFVGGLYTAPGQEIIDAFGEYFDREAEATRVSAALDDLAAENQRAQQSAPQSLSVVMSWAQDDMPLYMDGANSLHSGIAASGFTRPALQDEIPEGGSVFGGWTAFSAEQLPEQDADVLAIAVAEQYSLEGVTGLPLFDSLGAVQNDRDVVVDGDLWSGGAAFYSYWVLRDLARFTPTSATAGTADDATERWADFLAETAK